MHLKSRGDVNPYSESKGTPLSVAAYNGRDKAVELLLKRHAKASGYYGGHREKALHAAAERGYEFIVRRLLEHGADANAIVCGVTALYVAASKGHWGSVQVLLDLGADDSFLAPSRSIPYNRFPNDIITYNGSLYQIADSVKSSSIFLVEDDNFDAKYLDDDGTTILLFAGRLSWLWTTYYGKESLQPVPLTSVHFNETYVWGEEDSPLLLTSRAKEGVDDVIVADTWPVDPKVEMGIMVDFSRARALEIDRRFT